jgi:hypothetical protein
MKTATRDFALLPERMRLAHAVGEDFSFRASLGTLISHGIFIFPREISSFSLWKIKIPWEISVPKLALRDFFTVLADEDRLDIFPLPFLYTKLNAIINYSLSILITLVWSVSD